MNSCIVITSYLSNPHKEQVALDLLNFLKDKNLPIIFVGNYKIPELIQEKSDWVLYTKENPKINRRMCVWNQIPYNPKFRVIANTPDHGYAHLLQAYRGFKLADSLGYDHVIHLNYDLDLNEEQLNTILDQVSSTPNLTFSWQKGIGCATNAYCFKIIDFIFIIDNCLHFYKNNNPPNIPEGWYCEIFFKWALDYSNINYSVIDVAILDKVNEEFLYLNNYSFKAYVWEEQNQIIFHFEHMTPDPNSLMFSFEEKVLQVSCTPSPKYFTLPFKKGKYYDIKGNLIFTVDDTFSSQFGVIPM